ncbi:MAG: molybdenum cofactor synthesis domain-containing protein [Litoreibacter sp.]
MKQFDAYIIVGWSSENDRGATPKKDAIWIGEVGQEPIYMRNRHLAEEWLGNRIKRSIEVKQRLAIGFDFPFGYPSGFGESLTGSSDPLKVWDWLEGEIEDHPDRNNRFDVAGQINQMFDGVGPFWANGLPRDIDHLPRKANERTSNQFPERRLAETRAKGRFTCWQMAGADATGSRAFTGLPTLSRLRKAFPEQISVWPFEPLDTRITFIEVWPALVADQISGHEIEDAAQVKTLASLIADMDHSGLLEKALEVDETTSIEGWILGVGAEELMQSNTLSAPELNNDCFAMPQGVSWTPVDAALDVLERAMRPVVAVQSTPVSEALGAVLAADATALRSNPPRANSAVDGYGFGYDAVAKDDAHLPLIAGRAAAGVAFEGTVPGGSTIRILTGAIIPQGVDTVVLEEDCNTNSTHVAFKNTLKKGANTRAAGEDIKAGEIALPAHHRLRPHDLALLTALGHAEVKTFEPLRVGVLSTGDELTDVVPNAPDSKIFDANRPMLLSLAKAWHHVGVDLGHVNDDRELLAQRLTNAAKSCDAIMTTGGASAGDEDHVSALLRETGSLNTWRVALKPGRPLALGIWEGKPIFGLPGNPVAAFTTALIFARPALSKLGGAGWIYPQVFTVPAAFTKQKKPGRRELLRARLNPKGHAEVYHSEGSGRISGLSWSDGFVELPDAACEISYGTPVRYMPYSGFGL